MRLRHTLTRLALAVCRAALEAGRPAEVLDTAERLTDRGGRTPELDALRHAAQDWTQASEQADRGDFLLARDTLQRARQRVSPPESDGLDRFLAQLDGRAERFRQALGPLDDAAGGRRWADAVRWADEAIARRPQPPGRPPAASRRLERRPAEGRPEPDPAVPRAGRRGGHPAGPGRRPRRPPR